MGRFTVVFELWHLQPIDFVGLWKCKKMIAGVEREVLQ